MSLRLHRLPAERESAAAEPVAATEPVAVAESAAADGTADSADNRP